MEGIGRRVERWGEWEGACKRGRNNKVRKVKWDSIRSYVKMGRTRRQSVWKGGVGVQWMGFGMGGGM